MNNLTECPNCGVKHDDSRCTTFKVGEIVRDLLTKENCEVIKILPPEDGMTEGIQINHKYLGGFRFPWEISKIMFSDKPNEKDVKNWYNTIENPPIDWSNPSKPIIPSSEKK